jgi:hypothetical protein
MDKIKEKLHIGSSSRKSQAENDTIGSSMTSGHGVGTIEGTLPLLPSHTPSSPFHHMLTHHD